MSEDVDELTISAMDEHTATRRSAVSLSLENIHVYGVRQEEGKCVGSGTIPRSLNLLICLANVLVAGQRKLAVSPKTNSAHTRGL